MPSGNYHFHRVGKKIQGFQMYRSIPISLWYLEHWSSGIRDAFHQLERPHQMLRTSQNGDL